MAFPILARYKLRFRHTDTGLAPVFLRYARFDTLAPIVPSPAIYEVGGGDYYFEVSWASAADPDIDFEVDGGPSIPTEEVRYISDVLSVRDFVVSATGGGSSSSGGGAAWTVGALLLGLLSYV